MTLRDIITPLSVEEFLRICRDREFFHGRGSKGRYADLLPWEYFNQILDQHRLDYPRLRLFRSGEALAPASYIDHFIDFRRIPYTRANAERVHWELWNGAMIHFADIDEMSLPIQTLTSDITKTMRAPVSANVFLGTNDSVGFATHRDGHDVLVVQVHGRKHWRIFGFTNQTDSPELGARRDDTPPPHPVWEGAIEEGDFLYIPKGCWHSASGNSGPTLHLTFGIRRRNGIDYLLWLLTQLREQSILNEDIPNSVNGEHLADYLASLSTDLLRHISTETAAHFLDSFGLRRSHAKFTLPHTSPNSPPSNTREDP